MRRIWYVGLVLAVLCGAAVSGSRAEDNYLKGDYVEVRTASVFAGACHYNGEVTTTGRDAIMSWRVTSGSWNGVDLSGVRAIAIVSAEANLSDAQAARRSELIVDQSASRDQEVAMMAALKNKYAASLGEVVAVRSARIDFKREEKACSVSSNGIATISMLAMPDDLCCKMPQLVWYQPLVPLTTRKVGYTTKARYSGGRVGDAWERDGENSAFYGSFEF